MARLIRSFLLSQSSKPQPLLSVHHQSYSAHFPLNNNSLYRSFCSLRSQFSFRYYGKCAHSSGGASSGQLVKNSFHPKNHLNSRGSHAPSSGQDKKSTKKHRPGRGVEGKFVYSLDDVSKFIGDVPLFENVSLKIFQRAKIGILGINGSGKSSLLRIIAGEDLDYEGSARTLGNYRIGYLPQEPELDPDKTVLENVLSGVPEKVSVLKTYNILKSRIDEGNFSLEDEQAYLKVKKVVDEEKLMDLQRRVEVSMDALRCPSGHLMVDNLSGGECRRISLCRLLISAPDILLLDEPTNHLDAESVAWLEHYLNEYKGVVFAITHDRYFLDNVAGWILEIDRGKAIPFDGNYTEWLAAKQIRLDLEKKKEASRLRQIKQELEWINTPPKGRQSKNKARIARYQQLFNESRTKGYEVGQIVIPPGPRLGDIVVKVHDLKISFDGRILFTGLNFVVQPGAVVGVIGPNGVGKSTLIKILIGELQPDQGSVHIGSTVSMCYVSQTRVELDDDETVVEAISEGNPTLWIGDKHCHIRAYISSFNLKGSIQERLVGSLSGGERNRVLLAKALKNGCNLLLLDEPSNDLDVDTLRSLEDAISTFSGSAIVISHDRWFLDRICTHILAFEGNSKVTFFDGNYSAYELDYRERLGKGPQARPTKYRRLVQA
ncbi:energy-dependent translational throttle protein EttA-like [Schistocerca gregaria]|uniref:energy-dependent translational throttle protein EttA-like n=1 Tax=Schistocerca gregaria TaxID=7010 RepID=UPI00211F4582|nr:energy-dependent translational throttle protein EttA-like [Schistocerca gregaria]